MNNINPVFQYPMQVPPVVAEVPNPIGPSSDSAAAAATAQNDRIYTINNIIHHYSSIIHEYQQTVRNRLSNNAMVQEYTKRIRDYQHDMYEFMKMIDSPNDRYRDRYTEPPHTDQHTHQHTPISILNQNSRVYDPPSSSSVVPPFSNSSLGSIIHPPISRSRNNSSSYLLYTTLFTPIRNNAATDTTTIEPTLSNMENVVVAPTREQINRSVEIVSYSNIEPNTRCPISLEEFNLVSNISRIRYCGHIFKTRHLNTWFRNNVRCPVCRYDIRDYTGPVSDISDLSNRVISSGVSEPPPEATPETAIPSTTTTATTATTTTATTATTTTESNSVSQENEANLQRVFNELFSDYFSDVLEDNTNPFSL